MAEAPFRELSLPEVSFKELAARCPFQGTWTGKEADDSFQGAWRPEVPFRGLGLGAARTPFRERGRLEIQLNAMGGTKRVCRLWIHLTANDHTPLGAAEKDAVTQPPEGDVRANATSIAAPSTGSSILPPLRKRARRRAENRRPARRAVAYRQKRSRGEQAWARST